MSVDLHHHGDRDAAPGLVDLAVNVRLPAPPPWLADVVARSLASLGTYPDAADATARIAARHRVPVEAVLPTAGAAEAFTLLARALRPVRPSVVHPQFTEPEAALVAAGHEVHRHVLRPTDGFRLDPAAYGPGGSGACADLVVVGNPTNPTGVLHQRADVLALRAPGRVLVVDEAFMDAVPGETESLLAPGPARPDAVDLTGTLVVRSLTKTWGLAGLRIGYVVGDPGLVARLRAVQPPWSVSTPALAAATACSGGRAAGEAQEAALAVARDRATLVAELDAAGFPVAGEPATPFVLVDTSALGPGSVRPALADAGFAVRRGESFPGLGPAWIRVAVRDAATSRSFVSALSALRSRRVA